MYLVYCGALSGRRLLMSTQLESHNNQISHGLVFIIVVIIILLLPTPLVCAACMCCCVSVHTYHQWTLGVLFCDSTPWFLRQGLSLSLKLTNGLG